MWGPLPRSMIQNNFQNIIISCHHHSFVHTLQNPLRRFHRAFDTKGAMPLLPPQTDVVTNRSLAARSSSYARCLEENKIVVRWENMNKQLPDSPCMSDLPTLGWFEGSMGRHIWQSHGVFGNGFSFNCVFFKWLFLDDGSLNRPKPLGANGPPTKQC